MEGPFWKEIRGLGLSYDYGIYHSRERGTVMPHGLPDIRIRPSLPIFKCSDFAKVSWGSISTSQPTYLLPTRLPWYLFINDLPRVFSPSVTDHRPF